MKNEDYVRGLVKYTSRDYVSLKNEFFDLVPKLTSLWTPEADADPRSPQKPTLSKLAPMLVVTLLIQFSNLLLA